MAQLNTYYVYYCGYYVDEMYAKSLNAAIAQANSKWKRGNKGSRVVIDSKSSQEELAAACAASKNAELDRRNRLGYT